jgi:hypothetical protein
MWGKLMSLNITTKWTLNEPSLFFPTFKREKMKVVAAKDTRKNLQMLLRKGSLSITRYFVAASSHGKKHRTIVSVRSKPLYAQARTFRILY